MIRNSQKYCKRTDILTDKMTDKELQRMKIMEEYFEKNNYIDNSEAQKNFECFGFYGEKIFK